MTVGEETRIEMEGEAENEEEAEVEEGEGHHDPEVRIEASIIHLENNHTDTPTGDTETTGEAEIEKEEIGQDPRAHLAHQVAHPPHQMNLGQDADKETLEKLKYQSNSNHHIVINLIFTLGMCTLISREEREVSRRLIWEVLTEVTTSACSGMVSSG